MQIPALIPQHGPTLEGIIHFFASEMFDFGCVGASSYFMSSCALTILIKNVAASG